MIAVTPVHVGVGRSPGVVDLPIARDGFGLPFVPASSLKGVMRSLCVLQGNTDCSMLYGPDVDEVADNPYVSPLTFTDAYLVLYPARIEDEEEAWFGYITSPLALARLRDLVGLCGLGECRVLEPLASLGPDTYEPDYEVEVNGVALRAARVRGRVRCVLEALAGSTGLSRRLAEGGVYIIRDDEAFLEAVEAGIIRQARVRLNYRTKTVEQGALWTEEYVSQGAVLAYALLARDSRWNSAACIARRHEEILDSVGWHVAVGGKETIGRGIVRVSRVPWRCCGGGQ